MTRVGDLNGDYGATEGQVAVLAGGGGMSMKNRTNNVMMNLKAETTGLDPAEGGARPAANGFPPLPQASTGAVSLDSEAIVSMRDGSFYISEMNYRAWDQIDTRLIKGTRDVPLIGFIY